MQTKTANIICLVMVVAAFVYAFIIYPSLPDQVPLHWNSAGEVDGYGSKQLGAFLFPCIALINWLIILFIKYASPKGFKLNSFAATINIIQVNLVALFVAIGVAMLLAAQGRDIDFLTIMSVLLSLTFITLGNFMGRFRKNFFIGIRTPWTLASEEVWDRTHRLAAWTMTLGGIVMLIGTFTGLPFATGVYIIVFSALVPVIYSFVIYRRIEGFNES